MNLSFQRYAIVYLLLCCCLFSCSSDREYKKNGISFMVPAGWSIEHEDLSSLICKENGIGASGSVTIRYSPDSLDRDQQIESYTGLMGIAMAAAHAKFDNPHDGRFGLYPARVSELHSAPFFVTFYSKVYSFYACEKTITVIVSQNNRDSLSNSAAIRKIISSFACTGEKKRVKKAEPPVIITEDMPSFKGGEEAMMRFIKKHIRYPEAEREAGISGTCYVSFVVEKDGSITEVKILRGVPGGPGCDKEAVRVVSIMPRWNPGKQKGKKVRVQFNLPIKYTLR